METKKFGGKLSLNKETISVLNQNEMDSAKGGSSIWCITAITIPVTVAYTLSEYYDVPTIGHDDGPYCISKEMDWCHGRG